MKDAEIATIVRVGDIVCLRSGGPAMTVTRVQAENEDIDVEWFSDHGSANRDRFPLAALMDMGR